MDACVDPDYRDDLLEKILRERFTSPAGGIIPDPSKVKNFSNDFLSLQNFVLMNIFNHLILGNSAV